MIEKSKRALVVCVLVLCTLILGAILLISSSTSEKDLQIEFDGTEVKNGTTHIILNIDNNTDNFIKFGWAIRDTVTITTDEGLYSYKLPSKEIGRRPCTISVPAEDLEGSVERVEISHVNLLDEDGHPDKEMDNLVVYDYADDIDGFEGSFPIITLSEILFFLIITVFVSIFAFSFITVISSFLRGIFQGRKNRYTNNPANYYGNLMNDEAARLVHEQAVNAHNHAIAMHQQMMDNHNAIVNQSNFDTFAHQSVTFINDGGFIPPPTGF
jgi:hypothetical protein